MAFNLCLSEQKLKKQFPKPVNVGLRYTEVGNLLPQFFTKRSKKVIGQFFHISVVIFFVWVLWGDLEFKKATIKTLTMLIHFVTCNKPMLVLARKMSTPSCPVFVLMYRK